MGEQQFGGSFTWKGKTYYRGPLVGGPFGAARRIATTPFPAVCPACGHDHSKPLAVATESKPKTWGEWERAQQEKDRN